MMDIGTHVRVTDGEFHGKSGEIVAIVSERNGDKYTVTPP